MTKAREGYETNPAFGMISIDRVTGEQALYGVDYPQRHFIRLTISTSEYKRDLSSDWFYEGPTIVEISMSEVQFARAICSMNSGGSPCTLAQYRDPVSGEFQRPEYVARGMPNAKLYADEVRRTSVEMEAQFKEAQKMLAALAKKGSAGKKQLEDLARQLDVACRWLQSNMGFVVQRSEESIQRSVEAAKTEFTAWTKHQLAQLGERALALHPDVIAQLGKEEKK